MTNSRRHGRPAAALRLAVCGALAAACTAVPAVSSASVGTVAPDQQHYEISAEYKAATEVLSGTETISFRNAGAGTLSTVYLRLWPNGQGGCGRVFVEVSGVAGGTAGAPSVECTQVAVALDTPLSSGETGEISLAFRDEVPGNWNFRYGISGDAAMLGNPFPVLALTDDLGTHHEPYTLNGESMYSAAADWDVELTIPHGQKAATTGVVSHSASASGGRTRLTIGAQGERDFAMAIGDFKVSTTHAKGVRIRFFAQQPERVPASRVLGWARKAVASFTDHYGAYDQSEIDLAAGTWHRNGFEFPGMLMIDPTRDVVYHEIAHLWWYGMVGDNQWRTPWTDEAFAEFSDDRLKGVSSKCDIDHPFAAVGGGLPLDSTMGTFDAQGHYVATIYIGGPCVLERLRHDWGNAAFDGFMSGLVTDYRGKVVDTCDVLEAMAASAPPGYDMNDFLSDARLDSAPC